MEKLCLDIYEKILVRLDVEDLIRCKSVCRSWHSLISDHRFIKAHLNNSYKNHDNYGETGHRRIAMTTRRMVTTDRMFSPQNREFEVDHSFEIVGSSNGLVCIISTSNTGVFVANPSTREVKKLRNPQVQFPEFFRRDLGYVLQHFAYQDDEHRLCWGFGYDASIDDYKVVLGFTIDAYHTGFLVLTLKSNVWKFIGQVNYRIRLGYRAGTLCNGSLHWYAHIPNNKRVLLSFDLFQEEFKEIPRPECDGGDNMLGIFKDCLCTFFYSGVIHDLWVLKNYNVKQYWEHLSYSYLYPRKYSHVFSRQGIRTHKNYIPPKNCVGRVHTWFSEEDNGTLVYVHSFASILGSVHIYLSTNDEYISAPVFVQSLVSPHGDRRRRPKRKRQVVNIKGSRKLIKGDHVVPGSSARV